MIQLPALIQMQAIINDSVYEVEVANNDLVLNATVATVIQASQRIPSYEGPYTVTPSDEAVVLLTEGLYMEGNVTVEKIPSNYGKIGWNGSYLTVS